MINRLMLLSKVWGRGWGARFEPLNWAGQELIVPPIGPHRHRDRVYPVLSAARRRRYRKRRAFANHAHRRVSDAIKRAADLCHAYHYLPCNPLESYAMAREDAKVNASMRQ